MGATHLSRVTGHHRLKITGRPLPRITGLRRRRAILHKAILHRVHHKATLLHNHIRKYFIQWLL